MGWKKNEGPLRGRKTASIQRRNSPNRPVLRTGPGDRRLGPVVGKRWKIGAPPSRRFHRCPRDRGLRVRPRRDDSLIQRCREEKVLNRYRIFFLSPGGIFEN